MPAYDISIIIVSWNTKELLTACLASIAREIQVGANNICPVGANNICPVGANNICPVGTNNICPVGTNNICPVGANNICTETFVVDNNSTDGSPQMVADRFPWVNLLVNEENVGFAKGNNQAIEQATGRYILLLNPDTELKADSLTQLYHFLESRPEIGMVGPRLLNGDGSLQPSCFKAPTLLGEFWLLFHLDTLWPAVSSYPVEKWAVDESRPVEVLKGACMLLRRPIFSQIGLLDTTYFIYSEEVDLCYRIRRAGWQIYWHPQSQVIHYGGQSTSQVANKMFIRLYEAKTLYFRLNHGRLAAILYKIILLKATLLRLSLTPLTLLEPPIRRQNHLALASRYWQLLRQLPYL